MINAISSGPYNYTLSFDGVNLRTSQRAYKKFFRVMDRLRWISSDFIELFHNSIAYRHSISKNIKFTQNEILDCAFYVLDKRYAYHKDTEAEKYDNIFHTILNRIDEEKETNLASKYLQALQEKVDNADGEAIKHRTKKNLFFSILFG